MRRIPTRGHGRHGRTRAALACLPLALLLCACGSGDASARGEHLVAGGDPQTGRALIDQHGCGTCHVIPGVARAEGHVGPPLTDWALRKYIAGNLLNTPENLIRWIENPDSVEPGTVMPKLVTREEARHIAAYLFTIGDPSSLGPPHPIPARVLHEQMGGHGAERSETR